MEEDGNLVALRCSVLFLRDSSVLLCRRRGEDVWVLPGGTPRRGEGTAAAARREVAEETGLQVAAERVCFVLETTSWDQGHHLVEIVFVGAERDHTAEPVQREQMLIPAFVPLDQLDQITVRPPIAGYIRGYARAQDAGLDPRQHSAAYLGNVWRPASAGGALDQAAPTEYP